jgi:DNA adenine methylase
MSTKPTPLPYYGGKSMMLDEILPLIPMHKIYLEPYFGGGAVFWAKVPASYSVINDRDDNCINFYRVMKGRFGELERVISATLFAESEYKRALRIYRNPDKYDELTRAWAFYTVVTFSFGKCIGSGFGYSITYPQRNLAHRNRKFRFKEFEGRLDNVLIFNRDAVQVIEKYSQPGVFCYVDPPYSGADQGHYRGYTEKDLRKLLKTLEKFPGKFLFSNYPSDLIDGFVKRNNWQKKIVKKRLCIPKDRINRYKEELLVWNYQESMRQKTLF